MRQRLQLWNNFDACKCKTKRSKTNESTNLINCSFLANAVFISRFFVWQMRKIIGGWLWLLDRCVFTYVTHRAHMAAQLFQSGSRFDFCEHMCARHRLWAQRATVFTALHLRLLQFCMKKWWAFFENSYHHLLRPLFSYSYVLYCFVLLGLAFIIDVCFNSCLILLLFDGPWLSQGHRLFCMDLVAWRFLVSHA